MADLNAFMAAHEEQAWAWGTVDCSMVLADWAIDNGHPDPAAALRGTYSDELGWKLIVVARGGLLPLVSDLCARAGFTATDTAARGVIGVVGSVRHPDRQWGAIHDGERWLVRAADGFGPITAPTLGMWVI